MIKLINYLIILKKINIGNDDVKTEMEEIKSYACIVNDENQQMKENIATTENKMEQMNRQIQELSKENDSIKDKLDYSKELFEKFKLVIYLIRNFLKNFKFLFD